jgi:cell division protein WhiA
VPVARGQFTVRVKEELAALRPDGRPERRALLAALLRFAATLHIGRAIGPGEPLAPGATGGPGAGGSGWAPWDAPAGPAGGGPGAVGGPAGLGAADPASGSGRRFTLVLASRSGGVARLGFWLLHTGYGVKADFRVRSRGALAPAARYEVVLAEQVERVLTDAGILDAAGRLTHGIPGALVRGREPAACYLRGAFLGRGSVSAPAREPHLEIGAPDERTAAGLAAMAGRLGLPASASVRADQDTYRVLLKGGESIGRALATMGASSAYLAWEDSRIRREVRGEAVRLSNADQANLRRSVAAAMAQVAMVEAAVAELGWEALPADVADVAALRLANPEATLTELGALLDPPRSKGAVLARLRRLVELREATDEHG